MKKSAADTPRKMETWQELRRKKQRSKGRRRGLLLLVLLLLTGGGAAVGVKLYQDEQAALAAVDPTLPGEGETAFYARVLSAYGNEITYLPEDSTEEVTELIPVGTPVTTALGAKATFSRLGEGDRILVIRNTASDAIDRIFLRDASEGRQGFGGM